MTVGRDQSGQCVLAFGLEFLVFHGNLRETSLATLLERGEKDAILETAGLCAGRGCFVWL